MYDLKLGGKPKPSILKMGWPMSLDLFANFMVKMRKGDMARGFKAVA